MSKESIKRLLKVKKKTILGVGPMSKNCVDVVIDLANDYHIPMILIATRRQIECKKLGGGYVNNWTTEEFAKYVKERDKKGIVLLARDHGGPWQGNNENDLTYDDAMKNALISYEADIESGFDILHIDPSLGNRHFVEIVNDVHRLYDECETIAEKYKRDDIIYEVGTEEHSGKMASPVQFENFVREITTYDKIKFVVGNTGTHVKETRNVGTFNLDQAKSLVKVCNKFGVKFKEHNLDYTDVQTLRVHPEIGIHSANIAPEFGVIETKKILSLLDWHSPSLHKQFIDFAVKSKKWEKWMVGDVKRTNEEKAIICGHYVYSSPEIQKILDQLREKVVSMDTVLQIDIESQVIRYLRYFGWDL